MTLPMVKLCSGLALQVAGSFDTTVQKDKKQHLFFILIRIELTKKQHSTSRDKKENRSSGFPTWSDTNQPLQSQKKGRILKFWV